MGKEQLKSKIEEQRAVYQALKAGNDGTVRYKEFQNGEWGTDDENYTNRLRLAYYLLYCHIEDEEAVSFLFGEELKDREQNSFQGIGSTLKTLTHLIRKYNGDGKYAGLLERAKNANFDCACGYNPDGQIRTLRLFKDILEACFEVTADHTEAAAGLWNWAKAGEVYAFYVEMLGKYGACQILAVDGKSICYVLLDYLEDELPGKDILEGLQPYHRESFRYHHQMIKTGIENTPVPRDYRYIDQCGLKSSPVWDSYSWKWPTGEDYYYEERWKSFDETARSAYKKYINSGDFVSVHGRMFRKNTGGLRDEGWLRDNLEDPLRHWDGNEFIPEAAYRSARKCYKNTKKLLTEAMSRAADRKEIEEIIRRYTQSFNKLNDRYEEFIETEEREDIFMAMQRLYEECILQGEYGQADENAVPVTLSEVWNVMDEVRENW